MLAWALLLSCAACGPNPAEPAASAAPRVIPVLTPLLVQDSACTRVTFTFVGSKNIEVTFPDRATCSSGVALIPGGTPTRNGSGSRNANIPIRLLNRSGYTLQGPARVVLSPVDRVILDPAGGDPNKLTPQNHDSVRAESGAWVWLAGGPGTVAVDDSSAVTTLVVRLASPAGSAQMSFTVDVGQLAPGGWPLLTDLPSLDTTKTVTLPGGNIEYFRTSAGLIFNTGVSDLAKQQFLGQHGLSVIGVTKSGKFFVSFPDPGTTAESLLSFFDFLEAQPEVLLVMHLSRSGMDESISARFPTDGSSRAAWFSQANPLWAMRAIRAPQAWGCETGSYAGSPLVHVGLLEWVHSPQHPELAASFSSLWMPEDDSDMKAASKLQRSVVRRNQLETHGAETAGLFTASGDDNRGIAGTAWRTRLSMYGLLSNERRPLPDNGFYKVIEGILEGGAPRILSVSGGYVDSSSSPAPRRRSIGWLESDLRDLMTRAPDLLLVVAAGNERRHVTPAAYESTDSVDVLRAAVLRLRVDSLYSERIIVVAGTEPGNEFWATNVNEPTEGSNSFAGATDIGAPAHAVMVMDAAPGGVVGIRPAWGTSLSAPMVAGAAALLLAMDPTLTAADVKRYLIRGSRVARYDSTTGMLVDPVAVKNVPNATFHQLDVYGALSLLSKERQGLPICGYSASVGFSLGYVFLEGLPSIEWVTDLTSHQPGRDPSRPDGNRSPS